MNENEQNFDELKRLLKLKRHEVPPPGYFNNFSGEVISRIRAGEAGGRRALPIVFERELRGWRIFSGFLKPGPA